MKGYHHIAIFALISLLIISPLIAGKYIPLLDSVVSPSAIHGAKSLSDFIYGISPEGQDLTIEISRMPLQFVSVLLQSFIPTFILQKIELFLIFFLPMFAMFTLLKSKKELPRYAASIFYAINPFTYMRFMAGHWTLLLGYALLPFLAAELIKKEKNPISIALWLSLISVFSTHILIMAFLLLIFFMKAKDIKTYAIIALLFAAINLYWIFPVITAHETKITPIGTEDLTAFRTDDSLVNSMASTAMMYGFWREGAYKMPALHFLLAGFIILLAVMVHGSFYSKHPLKWRFVSLAIISLLLAIGVSHPFTKGIFEFLFTSIPVMKGFREPQKFVALLALSYSFLLFLGLQEIKSRKVVYASFLIPLLLTPPLFASQLSAVDFPKDYYGVNSFLNKDAEDFNVLFLPWHLYMDFPWENNGRIANPSSAFFDKRVIKADNMELYPIYSHSLSPVSRYIEENINSTEKLSLINVKYILAAKGFSITVEDAEKVMETENLILYRNNNPASRFLESDDLKTFYPLKYSKTSPISYTVNPNMEYVIFTDAFNQNWNLGSRAPIEGYPVNIFLNFGEKKLMYSRFPLVLMGYLISALSLTAVLLRKFRIIRQYRQSLSAQRHRSRQ